MERKKSKWFSFTIFKESFKSNFVSLLIVGVGNALIALVVILILSTLSLNTTKQSMLNMFNTANMEHSLKQASAGAYIAFDGTIEAHETLLPEVETYLFTAYEGTSGAIDLLDGSYNTELVIVKGIYDEDYEPMESAPHPKQLLHIDLGIPLDQYDILRRREEEWECS